MLKSSATTYGVFYRDFGFDFHEWIRSLTEHDRQGHMDTDLVVRQALRRKSLQLPAQGKVHRQLC